MDGWKYEIKQDGQWLMKMKIVLQNQTYNTSKDIYQIYQQEQGSNQTTTTENKTDQKIQKLMNI